MKISDGFVDSGVRLDEDPRCMFGAPGSAWQAWGIAEAAGVADPLACECWARGGRLRW
jgi:hypothetical protein